RKQSITFQLASNYINSGKEKDAVPLLKQAYEDAPENPTAANAYAVSLILSGQNTEVAKLIASKPEIAYDLRVLAAYAKTKQYPKVIEGYKALIAKDPDNIQLYGSLAGAYLQSGRSDLAIAELQS